MARLVSVPCPRCHKKFGGHESYTRHFVAGSHQERCRDDQELREKGFKPDRYGVWVRERSTAPSASVGSPGDLTVEGDNGHANDALARLGAASRALAAATTLPDIKKVRDMAEAARTYAQAARMGLDIQNDAAEIKLRAERKAGEVLASMDLKPGPKADGDTLSLIGIARHQSSRWQRLASLPDDAFTTYLVTGREGGHELTTAGALALARGTSMNGLMSSQSGDWHTPPEVVAAVIAALGEVDLDPCSNTGTPNVPAKIHYTEVDDGLAKDWHGKVYMNPPYGRMIERWVAKLAHHHAAKDVPAAIALLPARPDTAWFAHLRDGLHCFIRGRLRFSAADAAPFPSVAVYLGGSRKRFLSVFSELGDVFERVSA